MESILKEKWWRIRSLATYFYHFYHSRISSNLTVKYKKSHSFVLPYFKSTHMSLSKYFERTLNKFLFSRQQDDMGIWLGLRRRLGSSHFPLWWSHPVAVRQRKRGNLLQRKENRTWQRFACLVATWSARCCSLIVNELRTSLLSERARRWMNVTYEWGACCACL